MIDAMEAVIARLEAIDALKGRVYRAWPQKPVKGTAALVVRLSRQVETVAWDGSELAVRSTYSINLLGESLEALDALEEQVTDAMASMNLHATSAGPYLVESTNLYRISIIVSGGMDIRGNVYS